MQLGFRSESGPLTNCTPLSSRTERKRFELQWQCRMIARILANLMRGVSFLASSDLPAAEPDMSEVDFASEVISLKLVDTENYIQQFKCRITAYA